MGVSAISQLFSLSPLYIYSIVNLPFGSDLLSFRKAFLVDDFFEYATVDGKKMITQRDNLRLRTPGDIDRAFLKTLTFFFLVYETLFAGQMSELSVIYSINIYRVFVITAMHTQYFERTVSPWGFQFLSLKKRLKKLFYR